MVCGYKVSLSDVVGLALTLNFALVVLSYLIDKRAPLWTLFIALMGWDKLVRWEAKHFHGAIAV